MTIKDLNTGQSAEILEVGASGALRGQLLDMGIIPGAEVELVKRAPMGDPLEIRVHGYNLSLRESEAAEITVREYQGPKAEARSRADSDFSYNLSLHEHNAHPGFGEEGKYHSSDHSPAIPDDTVIRLAIVGQHNCGKTALFNTLTGSNRHVGNFPGTTVERTDSPVKGNPGVVITDLPGLYSLSAYSDEEVLTRDFILGERPHAIINVVDAGNIERNLYLTVQLLELGMPLVLVLNMMDELRSDGGEIRINEMERRLGIPVVPVSAAKGEGLDELLQHAVHIARYQEAPAPLRFSVPEACDDPESEMARLRYGYIDDLCRATVRRPVEGREMLRSRKIDRILTGRWTAVPAFIAIIALVFYLTFDVIGLWLQNLLSAGISSLAGTVDVALDALGVNQAVRGLVVDAVFGGVGSVLSFVPIILVLFLFLSLLEDSGYMSRVAFVSDKLLRRLGLSGRSIVPMLIGFGCTVPGVMAARTLPSSRDRKLTILLLPFMSCSAKTAIYGFLCAAFFPGKAGLVMTGLYLLGIAVGVLVALVTKWTSRREAPPFVMELPVYRLPNPRNVAHLLWDKTRDFLQMAFTVIFIATIVVWFLQSFDFSFRYVDPESSMLAKIAGWIAPVMSPVGLGDWRIVTSLISGFLAKESIVSTMQVLGGISFLNVASAASMLVFCLLYTPCVASISSIRRELGRSWAVFVVVFQCAVAWVMAFLTYSIVSIL